MIISLRTLGAAGVLWYMASTAIATPTIDTSRANYPEWNEKSTLPSATASVPFMKDSAIELASDDEPAKADQPSESNCSSCQECNSSGCCDINYCCCPPWYVDAGVVILHREKSNAHEIMRPVNPILPSFTSTENPFGWNGDLDVTVGYRTDCCNAWEVRYFGDPGATDRESIAFGFNGAPAIGSQYTIATGGPFDVLRLDAQYQTDLHSIEINQRHTVTDNVTFISGFRYLELDEDLTIDVTIVGLQAAQYAWSDDNHLYGGQIGTDLMLWNRGPLRINSVVKGGLYGVASDNAFTNRTLVGTTIRNGGSASDVAFVGEIDLMATYSICQHVALRGGYQLLWIDGIALANNAATETSPANGGALIDMDGDLLYHGATAALEFTW